MKNIVPLLIICLFAIACGSDSDSDEKRNEPESRVVSDASPPEMPSIDPDREEALQSGSDLERLLARYQLLVDRVRLERDNGVYNANVAVSKGLIPIADDHHDLLERGLIDSTLHLEISMLAVHVLADHLNSDSDPDNAKFDKRLEKIRAMVPEHASAEEADAASGAGSSG